ncbi:MAG: M16 family metallopeptidase [Pseudanabaenaceae cyanobacterium]
MQNLSSPLATTLTNGIRLIAEQVPLEAVSVNLWFNVGSALETDEINGIAHFLEHMVFKGSDKVKLGEFEHAVESCGGNTNAATSHDYTNYYITIAPQDFARLAPLQLDVVMHTAIPPAEFERERLVVLEEIRRSNDNPDRRIYRQVSEIAHPSLPYRRCVLGPTEVIENLTPEQMRQFHRTWYVPEHLTITCVGNLPAEEMMTALKNWCEELPPLAPPTRPQFTADPPFREREAYFLQDARLQQARLVMVWRVPGWQDFRETLKLTMLAGILGGGMTARLVQDLREQRRLVERISVSYMPQVWQGTFQILAKLPPDNIPTVEQAIGEHLVRLQNELIPEPEIRKIRAQVASRFVFANESPRDRASIYGYYDRVVQNLTAAHTYPELINQITSAELQQTAQKLLNPNAYGILQVTAN